MDTNKRTYTWVMGELVALWFACWPDSGSSDPGSIPGWVIVLCSWARHFTLTVPLSIQEYKWDLENCQGNRTKYYGHSGYHDGLASHPGGVAVLLVPSC